MTYITENIIPGNYGKKFTTDVDDASEKSKLEAAILEVEGVTKVIFEENVYPLVFTIHTDQVVHVSEIQDKAKALKCHVIAKEPFFPLF
ncbi:heavy-metal-associated domain-containing protein [uncultured Gelidibacter sp.]|uniref:heavy-metal-associated domain-containing protein n=1 Tax=uncultured Gelidibacter sp. TaxID=259318 RepID=UPI0026086544|nr:heavy-metal-associated domain-containing protein [uncultured Gelidibacter sp.]